MDENAALIAEHLEAAGELHAAYGWHMRAGAWSTNRDIAAARLSWERARRIADALPADDPDQLSMRIAPRTMLCVTDWRAAAVQESRGRFAELRELCSAAGDKVSLAIGMTGLAAELLYAGRAREASRLASEQMALLESIGDPTLTMGLRSWRSCNWVDAGEFDDILRWSQTVIDLADGDPTKGASFGMGSPLAVALAFRGFARYWLGRPGWRQDLDEAVAMARDSDPVTHALIVCRQYGFAVENGMLRADDFPVHEIEETLQTAERSSGDTALGTVKLLLGDILTYRPAVADRQRGLELLTQVRDTWLHERTRLYLIPSADMCIAREQRSARRARRCDTGDAISRRRAVPDWSAGDVRLRPPPFWWRRCWNAAPRATSPKRKSAIERLENTTGVRGFGGVGHLVTAAACAAGPRPRRRSCLPRLGESLSRDGGIAWLRRTHRDGRGDVVH